MNEDNNDNAIESSTSGIVRSTSSTISPFTTTLKIDLFQNLPTVAPPPTTEKSTSSDQNEEDTKGEKTAIEMDPATSASTDQIINDLIMFNRSTKGYPYYPIRP
eukprot:TRINITY_DN73855_c0_g1_i1.p1 TRINITY_DN73855_c0_g1~~TRINITY_DN73855_c0_g1_i1.p1  ORF type:complete len:104 (+),score=27.79 TRINITY_DN73855_c0_g1_i1:3-314(+)